MRLKITSGVLLVLMFVQLYLGALVAGIARRAYLQHLARHRRRLHSERRDRLWFETPWWRNLFENTLTVQFEHRMTAYALFLLAMLHVC